MELVKYFIIAFFLSALGTIPIGLITLTIAQKTLEKGKVAGWQIAMGATVIEFVYTLIALYGLEALSIESAWKRYVQIGTLFLFLILGIYYYRKAPSTLRATKSSSQRLDFFLGMGVGMMNMLIIPFWLVVGLWLESNGMNFDEAGCIVWFSVGAALGALLIFVVYIEGSHAILQKSQSIATYANKVIGIIFFLLAIVQLFQLI